MNRIKKKGENAESERNLAILSSPKRSEIDLENPKVHQNQRNKKMRDSVAGLNMQGTLGKRTAKKNACKEVRENGTENSKECFKFSPTKCELWLMQEAANVVNGGSRWGCRDRHHT
ncbi:unnamed protein product [Dovyalis caffra]|uniref:Uncharacterized protein n=1 Tax=Dovyalis caffra TaxID=77055 RepID=A0AAV1SMY4_9ROSI|nr:unnamed protein product [Dovyalis caffra]